MKLLYDFVFIMGMLLAVIYIVIFFKSKERSLSKSILILFFAILFFALLESYAHIHDLRGLKFIGYLVSHGSKLLIGPLMLLYIQSLFLEDKLLLKKSWMYFAPYVLFMLFVSAPYLLARDFEVDLFSNHIHLIFNYSQYVRLAMDLILLAFIVRCFQVFRRFKRILKCNYSQIEHNNFIWVRYLLFSVVLVISIDLLFVTGQIFFNAFPIRSQNIVMTCLALSLLYGAYYGLNQSKVLVPYFLLENSVNRKRRVDAPKDSQQEQAFKALEASLLDYMTSEKPYLDEELTLNKLAIAIGTTDKKLSALLNQHIETSFYSFINTYRINEFKGLLASPLYNDYTIEGIAYECGFKSKASFYRLFKKTTGQSPSEYKNTLKH